MRNVFIGKLLAIFFERTVVPPRWMTE